jgi:general secretion pathway protein H
MLVLLIMGMVASMIIINPFREGPAEQLERAANRFMVSVSMASDYAVLNQSMLGVRFDPRNNSYAFVELNDQQEWEALDTQDWMAEHALPESITTELRLDGLEWQNEDSLFDGGSLFDESLSVANDGVQIGKEEDIPPPPPDLFLYPSGEIGDWELVFTFRGRAFDTTTLSASERPVLPLAVRGMGFLPVTVVEDNE